jgi:diguanylate cyclase (GGDEF)-like protein
MTARGDAAWLVAAAAVAVAVAVWLLARRSIAHERARARQLAAEAASHAEHGRVLESIADAFLAFDHAWQVRYANRETSRVVGRIFARLLAGREGGGPPASVQHRQYRLLVQEQNEDELGGMRVVVDRWIEAHAYPAKDGTSLYLHDNTERKRQEERQRISSLVDDLTGLYNRRGFLTLAEQHLKLAERTGRGVLLIYADLDDFKEINDRFGHNEGDRALAETARSIRTVFRDSDILARLGGDEFVVLALETSDLSGDILARRLREAMAERNARSDRGYALTLSIGVARYDPRSSATVADLLARADALMYEHKREKAETARRLRQHGGAEVHAPVEPPARREMPPTRPLPPVDV